MSVLHLNIFQIILGYSDMHVKTAAPEKYLMWTVAHRKVWYCPKSKKKKKIIVKTDDGGCSYSSFCFFSLKIQWIQMFVGGLI